MVRVAYTYKLDLEHNVVSQELGSRIARRQKVH